MRLAEFYLDTDFKRGSDDWEDAVPFKVLPLANDVDLWGRAISLDNKLYSVCCRQGDKHKVYEIDDFDIKRDCRYDDNEITCPVCKSEIIDSWEFTDDHGEEICESCGAEFNWTREVEVSYSAEVKKAIKPIRL